MSEKKKGGKKKKVTPKAGIRKLRTVKHDLAVPLSDDELLEYGERLAGLVQDIAAEDERQKSIKSELKAKLTRLEAERIELASKIKRKEEERPIDVETILDYDKLEYREVRKDTGEAIKKREMSDAERQMTFNV